MELKVKLGRRRFNLNGESTNDSQQEHPTDSYVDVQIERQQGNGQPPPRTLHRPMSAFDPVHCMGADETELSGRSICLLKIQEAIWLYGHHYVSKHPSIRVDMQIVLDEIDHSINLKMVRSLSADGYPVSNQVRRSLTASRFSNGGD